MSKNISVENISLPKDTFFIICILITAGFFHFFVSNLASVFNNWDPAFSWNRWAIDWYLGELPSLTDYYPQLIPANWSITYLIMQNHRIHLFAKSIMPLFAIFILFLFLNLYLTKKNITYLIGLVIYTILILNYGLKFIKSGYVDIAVSFFSFLAIGEIINSNKNNLNFKKVILILLFSSAAALTKQAGLYIILFFIGWIFWAFIKHRKKFLNTIALKEENTPPPRKTPLTSSITIISILIVNLSWYIIKIIEINRGFDVTYVPYLLEDIHRGRNYIERFIYGLNNLNGNLVPFFILLMLVILSTFHRKSKWVSLCITLPFIIIWGFWFSYDTRNLLTAFPFIAYPASFGIAYIYEKTIKNKIVLFGKKKLIQTNNGYLFIKQKILSKISKFRLDGKYILASSLILLIIIVSIINLFSDEILNQQINLQKLVGNPTINNLLYDYKSKNNIDGKILTDYYWITVLPGFEGSTIKIFNENDNFVILSNGVIPTDFLKLINSNIYGILISDRYYYNPKFNREINKKLLTGEFSIIFDQQGYHFIKVNSK